MSWRKRSKVEKNTLERGEQMTRTLQMVFLNEEGRNVTLSIPEARDGLEAEEVETVMTNILDRNIFLTKGGEISGLNKAQIISRDVEILVKF